MLIKHFTRRRSSAVGSIDSGGSDAGGPGGQSHHHYQHKTKYRVLVMGSSRVGKTSIISQFLYDQFSSKYKVGAQHLNQSSHLSKTLSKRFPFKIWLLTLKYNSM